MELYIQPNLTVFPTPSVLTGESIRSMIWVGFSANTTAEQIIAAGYIAVADPVNTQTDNTTLVVNKNQAGEYSATWMDNTELQQAQDTNLAATVARTTRNKLLQETDWTQAKDIPDNISSAWTTYRQALRDITSQEGFPTNINWPQKPV